MAERLSKNKTATTILSFCILGFLVLWFARYVQPSNDMAQHFLLIDEIMKHGGVRPAPVPSLELLAVYPPAAHWFAAVIGWIGGSGLVGLSIASITSVFVAYLIIGKLVGSGSAANVGLFFLAFLALIWTRSQIGWEINGNFFYPQLVGEVVYLGVLLSLSNERSSTITALTIAVSGVLTMWIQPLVAIHIMAAGIAFLAFDLIDSHFRKKPGNLNRVAALLAIIVCSVLTVALHPSFKVMKNIAGWNGGLEFGYSHVMPVAVACGVIGVANLWRRLRDRAEYVDAVLGSALVAAVGLTVLQYALFVFHGEGSPYAIKKHMFIVLTLGAMNLVRIVTGSLELNRRSTLTASLLVPIVAGIASFAALQGFTLPVAPVLRALDYANNAASFDLPDFEPGNTVSDDASLPTMVNWMISTSAFQHPINADSKSWLQGVRSIDKATYAMEKKTPELDRACRDRLAESASYMVVKTVCLKTYAIGSQLDFKANGSAWKFTGSNWGEPESWGAWALGSEGSDVTLHLPSDSKGPYQLIVHGMAYLSTEHPTQTVNVDINGVRVATWSFNQSSPDGERTAAIPESLSKSDTLRVVLSAPGAISPSQVQKDSPDTRILGFGVKTLILKDGSGGI